MEIYDVCNTCGIETDLARWQEVRDVWMMEDKRVVKGMVTIAYVCNDCYNKLITYKGRGWTKTKAVEALKKEIQDGKK